MDEIAPLNLPDAASYVIDECRMVLPGIQGLFGFQMIAVFNSGFAQKLSNADQKLHIVSIALVIVAMALIMTPAAIHRRAEPRSMSKRFIRVASRMILAAMVLLATGITLDAFLVAMVVLHHRTAALLIAIGLLCQFIVFWEVYPFVYRRRA